MRAPNGSVQEKVTKRGKMSKHSVILECGKRDKELMLLPTASFSHPAMVIDNAGCSSDHNESLIVVKPRSFWQSEFV